MSNGPETTPAAARPWRVKYDGTCSRCGLSLPKGAPAVHDRANRTIHCIECPTLPPAPPIQLPGPDVGVAGRSARAEYERREAKRDAGITERWGSGRVASLVRTFSSEPQTTTNWRIGAEGEERLAAELAKVPGLRMLHDRRVQGTRGNIDHIVIAPAGVFVVDAKNHSGKLVVRDEGGFFRTDHRLRVDGRDQSKLADGFGWQVDAVVAALSDRGVEPMPPVTAVLCFLRAEWPWIRPPGSFRGVLLESPSSLARRVVADPILTEAQADWIAIQLGAALPPK